MITAKLHRLLLNTSLSDEVGRPNGEVLSECTSTHVISVTFSSATTYIWMFLVLSNVYATDSIPCPHDPVLVAAGKALPHSAAFDNRDNLCKRKPQATLIRSFLSGLTAWRKLERACRRWEARVRVKGKKADNQEADTRPPVLASAHPVHPYPPWHKLIRHISNTPLPN